MSRPNVRSARDSDRNVTEVGQATTSTNPLSTGITFLDHDALKGLPPTMAACYNLWHQMNLQILTYTNVEAALSLSKDFNLYDEIPYHHSSLHFPSYAWFLPANAILNRAEALGLKSCCPPLYHALTEWSHNLNQTMHRYGSWADRYRRELRVLWAVRSRMCKLLVEHTPQRYQRSVLSDPQIDETMLLPLNESCRNKVTAYSENIPKLDEAIAILKLFRTRLNQNPDNITGDEYPVIPLSSQGVPTPLTYLLLDEIASQMNSQAVNEAKLGTGIWRKRPFRTDDPIVLARLQDHACGYQLEPRVLMEDVDFVLTHLGIEGDVARDLRLGWAEE